MISLLASYNDRVTNIVLENASVVAKYTSHEIQKEILYVFANKVGNMIHEDIENFKFCIIVDEVCDEFKKEQMALILRFVDVDGLIREYFFDIAHVTDTSALTLKNKISSILFHHYLDIQNIYDQGYDEANNIRGE